MFTILAHPGVSSEFVLLHEIWSLGSFLYLTACKVKEPVGRPQSLGEAATPPIPAWETEGPRAEGTWERAIDTCLKGRTEGPTRASVVWSPEQPCQSGGISYRGQRIRLSQSLGHCKASHSLHLLPVFST